MFIWLYVKTIMLRDSIGSEWRINVYLIIHQNYDVKRNLKNRLVWNTEWTEYKIFLYIYIFFFSFFLYINY